MLSREYSFFTGIVLVIMAIAGFANPTFLGPTEPLGSLVPTLWLIVGLVSLIIGGVSRNVNVLRTYSSVVGVVLLLWGVVSMFYNSATSFFDLGSILEMVLVGLGALGLAAALSPAQWIRESDVYARGRT